MHQDCTHLIAIPSAGLSEKHMMCTRLGKPVMRFAWLHAALELGTSATRTLQDPLWVGRHAPYPCALPLFALPTPVVWLQDDYRLQPFEACVVCATSITSEIRDRIAALVTQGGGSFTTTLNKSCTHLIAPAKSGKKYSHAVR